MFAKRDIAMPYSTYPRDVTSPGPDQRPGVAQSERAKIPSEERLPPSPPKDGGDKQTGPIKEDP